MSVVSGVVGAVTARKGAKAQASAANRAGDVSQAQFEQTREDLAPFREAGVNALSALNFEMGLGGRPRFSTLAPTRQADLEEKAAGTGALANLAASKLTANTRPFGGFTATPGYGFQVSEGQKAVERSAAARGMTRSGATMKDLTRFGQGVAAQEYGNYMNRLSGIAGTGQTATNTTAARGAESANVQGNALMAAGQARASGYAGVGQGIQQGIQGVGQIAAFGTGQGWWGNQTPAMSNAFMRPGGFY